MEIIALIVIVIFVPTLFLMIRRADLGARFQLRRIEAYDSLSKVLAQATESGQPIHISLGTAGINGTQTAETTAGLQVLDFLGARAAISAIPPIVTVGDATTLPLAQDQLRRAFTREGYSEEYDPRRVRFIAPQVSGSNIPYAVGALDVIAHEHVFANVMVGSFGDEFLLMAEPGAQKNVLQVGGSSTISVLPFVQTSVEHPLMGEEIYAAGAYLANKPEHVASLFAQDAVRVVLVLVIIVGALLRVIGVI